MSINERLHIDERLHAVAEAVSDLWTDTAATQARYTRLRARLEAEAAPSPPVPGPVGPNTGERLLSEARFLTVAEVAARMQVSKMTVYRLVHAGHLPAIRVGRSFRVPEQAVDEYLRENVILSMPRER